MLYILKLEGGFVKVGYTKQFETRAKRGYWHCKHPTELCERLDDYELIHLYECTEAIEKKIHLSLHERIGEFYKEEHLKKIIDMIHEYKLQELPFPVFLTKCQNIVKQACCGGKMHQCYNCEKVFKRSEHLYRHVRNVHGKKKKRE